MKDMVIHQPNLWKSCIMKGKQWGRRFAMTVCLFYFATLHIINAQVLSLTASVDHIRCDSQGEAAETNSEVILGKTDNIHFLLYPDTSDKTILGGTYCGWDGEFLRWYQVLPGAGGTGGAFLANRLTTNSFILAAIQGEPVPRAADRGIQCLSLLLLSPSELIGLNQFGTNAIRIDGQLHIPEMYSLIEVITNPVTGRLHEIIAHAPNWVWVIKNNIKERVNLPAPLNEGFTNWTLTVIKDDDMTGLPAQFDFEKYFYNLASVKDNKASKSSLVGRTLGVIHYAKDLNSQSEWLPLLPVSNGAIIHDYRPGINLESMPNVVGLTAIMRRAIDPKWTLYPLAEGTNDEWHGISTFGKDEPSVSHHRQLIVRTLFVGMVLLPIIGFLLLNARRK